MKILITGATGLVGKTITKKLVEQGHQINVLTRNIESAKIKLPFNNIQFYEWKNSSSLPPKESFKDLDGIIHLMGENIGDKRWSAEQKNILINSRIESTKNISIVVNEISPQLSFFISASAIGIYPSNLPNTIDEDFKYGEGFLSDLCKNWEKSSESLPQKTRKVFLRTGVVLDKSGGALKKMLPPFYLGLGGILGNGQQYMSWIHYEDLANLYIKAATDSQFQGPYNAVSNFPVTNLDFTKSLGQAIHRPTLFPVPSLVIKTMFGEMSSVILDSQRVVSKKLPISNFEFKFSNINDAFNDIFKN